MRRSLKLFFCCTALILVLLALSGHAAAQQYNFYNYSVNEGLIQSQVTGIVQDKQGHIWSASEGGVSRFDGKKFTHFTEEEGLISNIIYSIACDASGRIWFGTDRGLSVFNSKKFEHILLSTKAGENVIKQIVAMRSGDVYALAAGKLYQINGNRGSRILINGDSTIFVTSLGASPDNFLWCGTLNKGLFKYNKTSWLKIPYPVTDKPLNWVTGQWLFRKKGDPIVATNHGIYTFNNKELLLFDHLKFQDTKPIIATALQEDADGGIWIGQPSGAIMISKNKVIVFNASNGYSDSRTNKIFTDRDENVWLATDGQGIFRYSGSAFIFFNKESGLPNPIVMSLTKGRNNIWAGTYGGGVVSIEKGKLLRYPMQNAEPGTSQVMTGLVDETETLWIGTYTGGILKLKGSTYTPIANNQELYKKAAVGELYMDQNKVIWAATSKGFGFIKDDRINWVKKTGIAWGFANFGNQLIVSTDEGLFYTHMSGKMINASKITELKTLPVVGIKRDGQGNYWLQTNGRGIVIWDNRNDKIIKRIRKTDGLTSNTIYSVIESKDGSFWVGTGLGLNKIEADKNYNIKKISHYTRAQGMLGMEANKNALLQDNDGKIYYGTTSGLFINNEDTRPDHNQVKEVILQAVKLFGKPLKSTSLNKEVTSWYDYPSTLNLKHNQNNLTFEFLAINFRSADELKYQYYLEGADDKWQYPSSVNSVNYSSLQSGNYIFKIRAKAGNSSWSATTEYPFTIATPFYQTWIFRLLVIIGLILTGIVIKMIATNRKLKRQEKLQTIRMEEQNKVRQKTAEDFHDEMGNKLTRISLLTDILKGKLNLESKEALNITNQIQDNARELYTGTKDIIWSLNPSSDNIIEILDRLHIFGMDLFQETDTKFRSETLDKTYDELHLPIDYSRNIIMIFKEALHNSLKYAQAREVMLRITVTKGTIRIELKDDGKGFEIDKIKKGNGINNMNIRSGRINGDLNLLSSKGEGTVISLTFKIPQNE